MGFLYNLVKRLVRTSIYISILLTLIVVIPNLPPYTSFTSIPLEAPLPREGSLAPNGDLNNAQKVYMDKLLGPEAFQVHKGELYTSLATGEIVKMSPGGHVTFVTKLGQPCTGLVQEHICGRPLGFEIDEKNNVMYVADAYHGIWKVNLKDDKKQLLVSPRVAIEGRHPKLFNAVTLSKNGDLYWTDSTTDFQLRDGAISAMCDPSGRLLQYNPAKNQSKVLMDNLWFPNGVIISPDNKFVVFAETSRLRLMKYYIDGPKKGQSEVLVAGLPGTPDNIRALPDGSGILVALYTFYDDENPLLIRSMAETPIVRKLLARVHRLVEIPFEYLNSVFPHVILEEIVYNIGHFKTASGMVPKNSALLYVDWNGKIISSHYNTDGSLGHISDAIVYNNMLYTGSPHSQNFIGSVPIPPALKKAFETAKIDKSKGAKPTIEVKREAPKPVVQEKPVQKPTKPVEAPKPTTPPPKPTTPPPKPVTPQPKPTTQPPKQATQPPKPTTQPPKPTTQPPKPTTQPPKPTTPPPKPTQAPVEKKPAPKPAEQAPKPAQQKPSKSEPPKQKQEPKPTPKVEVKTPPPTTTPPSKPASKSTPKVESTTSKPETKTKEKKQEDVPKPKKPIPEQIPIKEDISSDTAKPVKPNLKVIKKDGPAEIPNPSP